ncbi:unnamed protein product [Durusdinium trenchii]|uniref:Uncharacterized protein n=1 Tax=Durusdinium trenchii TaxID=1381693 RepID=A0ABP0HAN0_9DINO
MRAGPKSGSMINRGRLVIFVAVATLLQLHQIAFLKPARLSSVRRPQVTMGARTPGNQPTDEPDYPEFKPTGDYLFETPFFKMEKFKQDHGWRWEEANMGTVVCVAILLGPWLARVSGREPIIALVLRLALHSCRLSRTLVGMGQWWGRQL